MARIFLCHANEDKPQVREVYQRLKAEGFHPWLDEVDILPGQEWNYEIERALETSDFVMVFLSTRSVEKEGYVQREFRRALYHAEEMPEGRIHTIPVKLDDCAVPSQFRRHQWANLYENGAFDRIVRALHYGLQQRGQPLPKPLTHDPEESTRTRQPFELKTRRITTGELLIDSDPTIQDRKGSATIKEQTREHIGKSSSEIQQALQEIDQIIRDAEIDKNINSVSIHFQRWRKRLTKFIMDNIGEANAPQFSLISAPDYIAGKQPRLINEARQCRNFLVMLLNKQP